MTSYHSIARRAVETTYSALKAAGDHKGGGDDGDEQPKVSPIAFLIIFLTVTAFAVIMFAISYTYGRLIPTLCMIESPETTAYVPVNRMNVDDAPPEYTDEADDGTPKPATAQDQDAEILLVQNRPVTSSLRATVLHLRAKAGYWSRFRGLSLFILLNIARSFIVGALAGIVGQNHIVLGVAAVIAETILARWHMTWIHVVISEPSPRKWYKRVPAWNTWAKIAPAVALWAACGQIAATVPMVVCMSFGSMKHLADPDYEPSTKDIYAISGQLFLGMFLTLILVVGLQIPATVTMVRVAASMLPEEDETIVPFDRTFGGKTTPAIVGGQGKIGLVEAWKSFPLASRARLLKLIAKVALLIMAVWIGLVMVLTAEAHALLGDRVGDIMNGVHGITNQG